MFSNTGPELKFRFLWLVVGYALVALVIALSLVSVPVDMEMNFPYEDKLYHAFAYFTLMAWFSQIYHDRFSRILFALIFVFLGILLEYLQGFAPGRIAGYGDMVANTAGVALGFAVTSTEVRNYLAKIENYLAKIENLFF